MLDEALNLRIIDFDNVGLLSGDDSKTGMDKKKIGSPGYLSPEIMRKVPYYGYQSDVWAIGVIIFQLKFGQLPFYLRTDDENDIGSFQTYNTLDIEQKYLTYYDPDD